MVGKLHIAALNISQVSVVLQGCSLSHACYLQCISTTHSLTAEPLWIAGGKARAPWSGEDRGSSEECWRDREVSAALWQMVWHWSQMWVMNWEESTCIQIDKYGITGMLCVFFWFGDVYLRCYYCLVTFLSGSLPRLLFISSIVCWVILSFRYLLFKYQLYTGNAPKKRKKRKKKKRKKKRKIDCGTDWVEVLFEENLTGVFFHLEWH